MRFALTDKVATPLIMLTKRVDERLNVLKSIEHVPSTPPCGALEL